jgi:asparagine synthase (glutamine-hydrolysing)
VLRAALRTADAYKLRRGTSKPLLVRALGARLPREVWDRPKQGFQLPFDDWLRGELRGEVERAFSGDGVARVGLEPHAVRRVWRGFLERRGVTWSRPWALFALVRWAELAGASIDSPRSTVADLAIA